MIGELRRWRRERRFQRSIPGSSTSTACTRSELLRLLWPWHRRPPIRSRPVCAFSGRSTSSGKTLSPSGVTIISFLRPRMNRRPSASFSPMSPVCSQPSSSRVRPAPGSRIPDPRSLLVVARRDVLAADENLAVVGDLHLDAGDRLADRSRVRLERVIHRDDRRGFGQAVALDHDEPEPLPVVLERRRRAARRRR